MSFDFIDFRFPHSSTPKLQVTFIIHSFSVQCSTIWVVYKIDVQKKITPSMYNIVVKITAERWTINKLFISCDSMYKYIASVFQDNTVLKNIMIRNLIQNL